jgi:hypothetical protein
LLVRVRQHQIDPIVSAGAIRMQLLDASSGHNCEAVVSGRGWAHWLCEYIFELVFCMEKDGHWMPSNSRAEQSCASMV